MRPVSFTQPAFQNLSFTEQATPKWKEIAKFAAVAAAATLAYLAAGWIAFFAVAAVGIAYLVISNIGHGISQMDARLFPEISSLELAKRDLTDNPPVFQHPNKQHAYNQLTANRGIVEDSVTLTKVKGARILPSIALFSLPKPNLVPQEGPFSYPEGEHHWTANFGDSNVFFGCTSPLLAQDELQALEFPVLSHVRTMMVGRHLPEARLEKGSVLLVEGAKRYGALDTARQFPEFGNLYGNRFAAAQPALIDQALEVFDEPRKSNLFVFCAPRIEPQLEGQPYTYDHLKEIFQTAFTTFASIVKKDPQAVIHTGNWGCGAFGNNPKVMALLQIEAARLAGVRELRYHPLGNGEALEQANQLSEQIKQTFPTARPEFFLRHLTAFSRDFGLLYGRGDGN